MTDASFGLALVEDMPDNIAPGILYVSEEYEIACHRCACGCGSLVYTPLGPTEWRFANINGKPSLKPSIGNWALQCRSHYWITRGRVQWAARWSEAQVLAGRKAEGDQREAYYRDKSAPNTAWGIKALLGRLCKWLAGKTG